MAEQLSLFGQRIVMSEGRARYNEIRRHFLGIADGLTNDYVISYKQNLRDMDKLASEGHEHGLQFIRAGIQRAIEFLIQQEIYDVDENLFVEEYYRPYFTWEDAFEVIQEKYMEIGIKAEQLNEYRKMRRENRARLIGGGFGLSGAAKGIATAGALNAVSGTIHGLVNIGGSVVSSIGSAIKKDSLYNSPATFNSLRASLFESLLNLHLAVVEVLEENDNGPVSPVSDEEERRAQALFNNLVRHAVGQDQEIALLVEIFTLDPYEQKVYDYVLQKYGDLKGELDLFANYFSVNINANKEAILRQILPSIDYDDENALLEGEKKIRECMQKLGLSSNTLLDEVKRRLEEIDQRERTFDGVQYETREEAKQARDAAKVVSLYKRLDFSTVSRCKTAKEKLRECAAEIGVQVPDSLLKSIDSTILKLEEAARTVDGVLYATQEEAERQIDIKKRTVGDQLYSTLEEANQKRADLIEALWASTGRKTMRHVGAHEKELREYAESIGGTVPEHIEKEITKKKSRKRFGCLMLVLLSLTLLYVIPNPPDRGEGEQRQDQMASDPGPNGIGEYAPGIPVAADLSRNSEIAAEVPSSVPQTDRPQQALVPDDRALAPTDTVLEEVPVQRDAGIDPSEEEQVVTGSVEDASTSESMVVSENLNLKGTIGDSMGIHMTLTFDDGKVYGTYFYDKFQKEIVVSGEYDSAGNVRMDEYDNNYKTGLFIGRFTSESSIEGDWTNEEKTKKFPFYLDEISRATAWADGSVENTAMPENGDSLPGEVTGDGVRIRQEPSLNADVIGRLNSGDRVQILLPYDKTATWVKIRTSEFQAGWIHSDYIKVLEH